MEHYTIKNLPATAMGYAEDMRLTLAKRRCTFLWSALKNNVMQSGKLPSKIAWGIVLAGSIVLLALGHPWKASAALVTLLLTYGRFLWAINRLFSNLHAGNCFPVLTAEGPQYIMNIDDGERYIRIESAPWQEVENISFHSDFLVIEMKDESESGFFFMWSGDMEKAKRTALAMWSAALKPKDEENALPELYSENELAEVSDFIEENFGSYSEVIHEITSPDIHVDIAIIPPSEERPYYTLCTMGVGAHRMNVPDNVRLKYLTAERIELLIYLPADWHLTEESLSDERNYWPIRLLKDFARMSIETDSWVAWGHSLSQPDKEPFADGVPYSSAILLCPQPDIYDETSLPLSTGKSVDFYQVFPLTDEELEYKLRCAADDACEESPTDAMLDHFQMDREHWMEYAVGRL